MSIFIDLIVIAVFAICIFLGYKRGLVQLVLRLCSFVLALVISLVLFKPISNFVINNTEFDENIKNYIIEISSSETNTNNVTNTENSNSPEIFVKYINSSIEKATAEAKDNAIEYVADYVSKNIVSIIVLLILFIILRIVLIFIKIISDAITELPIIKQFNKSGGLIYGLIEALLIIYIAFAIIALLIKNPTLEQSINSTYIASMLYNNNLILLLLFK